MISSAGDVLRLFGALVELATLTVISSSAAAVSSNLFKMIGTALADLAAAKLVYEGCAP